MMMQRRVAKRLAEVEVRLKKGIKDKNRRNEFELISQVLRWVLKGGSY